jgi:hypothetical protein
MSDTGTVMNGASTTAAALTTQDSEQQDKQPRGAILRPDGRICIGRVGAPPKQEATSGEFFFWVPPDALVEKTQLVTCESTLAGHTFTFYAIVDEVYRCSRKRNMGHEVDEADNDLGYTPPFEGEGYSYAKASILRTEPGVFVAPRERSQVLLAGPVEAGKAYDADEIDSGLNVGLIKNGGSIYAGPGKIDLDYLLGANGGHMNVNGAAGRGTKSSFLLFINWMLLQEARRQQHERPSEKMRLRIVPIILNVKNFDLFYINQWSSRYDPQHDLRIWKEIGIEAPQPFRQVSFYAVQRPGNILPVPTGRTQGVKPYSWSLSDVIERGLFPYLFAETDANDANFGALALDLENWLTSERKADDGSITRSLADTDKHPKTFKELLDWIDNQAQLDDAARTPLRNHHTGTWKKLHRRLLKLLYEGRGALRRDDKKGNPLDLVRADTSDPIVVDLAALAGEPDLQRFVVATIFRQLVEARTGTNAVSGLVYLVTLDELNRFAPRGARDPITQLIETVAAEMRSQGIILLGAQQQASKVSEKVIENAAIRVLGKTGSLELKAPIWGFLSESARKKAVNLEMAEKLIIQDNFREPMHVRVPFPVWAMNPREALPYSSGETDDDLRDILE